MEGSGVTAQEPAFSVSIPHRQQDVPAHKQFEEPQLYKARNSLLLFKSNAKSVF